MRKHPHLTFQHRAGVRPNTSCYHLAESCVFIKQSLPPLLCHLNKVSLYQAPFIPKLQGHFAEFLQGGSLKRLSLIDSSTCVGLGYGLWYSCCFLRDFDYLHRTKSLSQKSLQKSFRILYPLARTIVFTLGTVLLYGV